MVLMQFSLKTGTGDDDAHAAVALHLRREGHHFWVIVLMFIDILTEKRFSLFAANVRKSLGFRA
jgi:hypothetical protein